ncbi:MAG: hypothetical protein H0X39_00370 [Actinobacteria bacterium]|nr:hypothetical protein [Actinomycetota bacterium]
MSRCQITTRQQAILDVIGELAAANDGYAPSSGEIACRLGMRNSSTVREQLQALRRKGAIDWLGGRKRTLRILKPEAQPDAREQASSAIDLGPGPQPNDHERALALRIVHEHTHSNGRAAALLTAIAKGLAAYRVEGMVKGVKRSDSVGQPVEFRWVPGWTEDTDGSR